MSEVLKCLSIRQPWAHLILHGGKDAENRTWRTDYRGPLVIHASKAYDREASYPVVPQAPPHACEAASRGALVGIVDLVDIRDDAWERAPWAQEGCWHWLLENPRPLPAALPFKGALGVWEFTAADLWAELPRGCLNKFYADPAYREAVDLLLEVMSEC